MAIEQKNANVRLLACLIDEDDTYDSDYRFLVDGQYVKYVTTGPGNFRGAEDDRTFEPILLGELFPPFPAGDWNSGDVANDPEMGTATFVRTNTLNEVEFTQQDRVRQRVHVSAHPDVNGGRPVLVKLAV
ncbi:Protein kinase-like domain protein [Cordyceps fumosorosea ARSEF 2679]|uniref:Protein kinase-like domain protein n=1 Tax=Cordyceps fumosorosea (strain ARSEF 2679) TaxID=1081104 RepID=A0A167S895_CORFA|nr:Protein kinase-like domain protein [Cordyceps fumosorosea ARSEF 2679]OAA59359.1 Protein kinase-like domain protein [Cordyceps fumosorosea ARSEF 2679]